MGVSSKLKAMARKWVQPPPIGSKLVLIGYVVGRTYGGRRGYGKGLGKGTRVRVVRHTAAGRYYGPGCFVQPTSKKHPYRNEDFYISQEHLCFLADR